MKTLVIDSRTGEQIPVDALFVANVPDCFDFMPERMHDFLALPAVRRLDTALVVGVTDATKPLVEIDNAAAADQMLLDLFTTAMEGGIGYWSECETYHWCHENGEDDLLNFHAVVIDMGEMVTKPIIINRKTMLHGYAKAVERRNKINWSSEKPPHVLGDNWDFDAADADIIVQLGVFGEVVYG